MTDHTSPRVLLITRNLPPLLGGMERLNWHIARELSAWSEVRIIGPEGSANLAPPGVAVDEVPLRPMWKFLIRARTAARRIARHWRPDIVLAGSGLTAPLARSAASVCHARTVAYVHGLDVAVRNAAYRAAWLRALRRMDLVIANSGPTAKLCRDAGIWGSKTTILHPGVQIPTPSGASGDLFRAEHGLGKAPVLVSVGRLSTRKGLCEFVARALPLIVSEHPDVVLLIVGGAPEDALHARAETPDMIRAAARAVGVERNLRFFGPIADYESLGIIYQAADMHVFPVRDIPGDPEGFGMVAIEAAAHGLPTIAFGTGGVVDAVCDGKSGRTIAPGDYDSFAMAVLHTLRERDVSPDDCREYAYRFSWPEFGGKLRIMLKGATE